MAGLVAGANRYAQPANFGHPIRTPLLREHVIYRAFAGDGHLVYVGCTARLKDRLDAHRTQSRWWHLTARISLAGPYNYETARQIEHDAIESERPQFNYTSEHRAIDHIRRRMIDRHIAALVAEGVAYYDAISPAVAVVDALVGEARDRLIDDLTVPTCRRVEREHFESLGGAA